VIQIAIKMLDLKTWHNYKDIYSVDMILAYLNSRKHPVVKLQVKELEPQLHEPVWGNGKGWSPMTVIDKIGLKIYKKYKEDADRIKEADLSYPIIVTSNHTLIDGYHRLAKAFMEGKKDINVNVIDSVLMRKFLLVKGMDFTKLRNLTNHDILKLYANRFCK